jgi:anthranilate 1,2-dioxygenase small subunit
MKEWYETFSERDDASYTCISAESHAAGLSIALMMDDCRGRIRDRITFVDRVWQGTFQDYQTRHFVQRLSWERLPDNSVKAISNFMITITPEGKPSQLLATGVYEDLIEFSDGKARFLSKRAIYDTTVLPQYIVYPF